MVSPEPPGTSRNLRTCPYPARADSATIGRSLRPRIVIIHGNEPGVDSSFAAAAKELGVTAEAA